jgi:hypothetical protein
MERCLDQNFSAGSAIVPAGKHTMEIAWAGKGARPIVVGDFLQPHAHGIYRCIMMQNSYQVPMLSTGAKNGGGGFCGSSSIIALEDISFDV